MKVLKRRLMVIGLIVAMVLSMITPYAGVGQVQAATKKINPGGINITAPIVGNSPDFVRSHYSFLDEEANSHISCSSIRWQYRKGNNWDNMSKTSTFHSGEKYKLLVTFSINNENYNKYKLDLFDVAKDKMKDFYYYHVKSGYQPMFRGEYHPEVGEEASFIDYNESSGVVTIHYVLSPVYGFDKLEYNVPEPVDGKTPYQISQEQEVEFVTDLSTVYNSSTIKYLEQLNIYEACWLESTDGMTYTTMDKNDTFEIGRYYRCLAPEYVCNPFRFYFYDLDKVPEGTKTLGLYDKLSVKVNVGNKSASFVGTNPSNWSTLNYVDLGQLRNTISYISLVDLVYPKAGQKPVKTLTPYESSKYTVTGVQWVKSDESFLSSSETFKAGQNYKLKFDLSVKDGYKLSTTNETGLYINGDYYSAYRFPDETSYSFTLNFVCPSYAGDKATVGVTNITRPKEGEQPDISVNNWNIIDTDFAKYKVTAVEWGEIKEDGECKKNTNPGWVFEAGKRYYADIALGTIEGNKWAASYKQKYDMYKVSVNDSNKAYIRTSKSGDANTLYIRAEFTPIEIIKEINISGYSSPVINKKASYDNCYVDSAKYSILTSKDSTTVKNGIEWGTVDEGGNRKASKVSDGLTFEGGKTFYTMFLLSANSGYLFADNPEINIGGITEGIEIEKDGENGLKVYVKRKILEQIKEIKYNIPAPVAGEKPGIMTVETTPENVLAEDLREFDSKSYWQVSTDGENYEDMPEDSTFEEGKYYRTNVHDNYSIVLFLRMLFGSAFDMKITSGLTSDTEILINGKNSLEEGVQDTERYVRFDKLENKSEPDKKDDKKTDDKKTDDKKTDDKKTDDKKTDDKKQDSKQDTTKKTEDSTSAPAKEAGKKVSGVGTISEDGKTLTDTDGNKYKVAEKVTNTQLKKNAKIADKKSGGKYRITKVIKEDGKVVGGTVEYMAPYNKNCTIISATGKVKLAGVTFTVTSIAPKCAKGCKKLTKVVLGDNITNIGKNAFNGCSKLKTINIKSTKLKKVGAGAFKGINKNASIKVPKAKKKAYTKLLKNKGQAKTVKIK